MKKVIRTFAAGGAAAVVLIGSATAALAQTSTYPVSPTSGSVAGESGSTAFTGASGVPFGMVMAGALLVLGLAALFVARRRSARTEG